MSKRGKEQVAGTECSECQADSGSGMKHRMSCSRYAESRAAIAADDAEHAARVKAVGYEARLFHGIKTEVSGYGLAHGSKGWLAVRVSNLGTIEVLTPKRNGLDEGVSKPLALQQMMAAQREYVLGLK